MRIIALKCDQCGAPLDVPADREQFSCTWCGSILHISKLPAFSTARREVSGLPSPPTQTLQAELDQLDAEWEAYRAESLPLDGGGEYVIPEPEACRLGAWATGILGGGVALLALFGRQWMLLTIVLLAVLGTIAVLLRQSRIAPVYQRSLRNYHAARGEILSRMSASS